MSVAAGVVTEFQDSFEKDRKTSTLKFDKIEGKLLKLEHQINNNW